MERHENEDNNQSSLVLEEKDDVSSPKDNVKSSLAEVDTIEDENFDMTENVDTCLSIPKNDNVEASITEKGTDEEVQRQEEAEIRGGMVDNISENEEGKGESVENDLDGNINEEHQQEKEKVIKEDMQENEKNDKKRFRSEKYNKKEEVVIEKEYEDGIEVEHGTLEDKERSDDASYTSNLANLPPWREILEKNAQIHAKIYTRRSSELGSGLSKNNPREKKLSMDFNLVGGNQHSALLNQILNQRQVHSVLNVNNNPQTIENIKKKTDNTTPKNKSKAKKEKRSHPLPNFVNEGRMAMRGAKPERTYWSTISIEGKEFEVEKSLSNNEDNKTDKKKIQGTKDDVNSRKFEPWKKYSGGLKCDLCLLYYDKDSVVGAISFKRIQDFRESLGMELKGRRSSAASFIYSKARLCMFCSQFFKVSTNRTIQNCKRKMVVVSDEEEECTYENGDGSGVYDFKPATSNGRAMVVVPPSSSSKPKKQDKSDDSDLAFGKTVHMSSISDGMSGNVLTSGRWPNDKPNANLCCRTKVEYQPWVEIDLGPSASNIKTIQLCNRIEPKGTPHIYRMLPFYIMVTQSPCSHMDLMDSLKQSSWSIRIVKDENVTSVTIPAQYRNFRFLRIQVDGMKSLQLAGIRAIRDKESGGTRTLASSPKVHTNSRHLTSPINGNHRLELGRASTAVPLGNDNPPGAATASFDQSTLDETPKKIRWDGEIIQDKVLLDNDDRKAIEEGVQTEFGYLKGHLALGNIVQESSLKHGIKSLELKQKETRAIKDLWDEKIRKLQKKFNPAELDGVSQVFCNVYREMNGLPIRPMVNNLSLAKAEDEEKDEELDDDEAKANGIMGQGSEAINEKEETEFRKQIIEMIEKANQEDHLPFLENMKVDSIKLLKALSKYRGRQSLIKNLLGDGTTLDLLSDLIESISQTARSMKSKALKKDLKGKFTLGIDYMQYLQLMTLMELKTSNPRLPQQVSKVFATNIREIEKLEQKKRHLDTIFTKLSPTKLKLKVLDKHNVVAPLISKTEKDFFWSLSAELRFKETMFHRVESRVKDPAYEKIEWCDWAAEHDKRRKLQEELRLAAPKPDITPRVLHKTCAVCLTDFPTEALYESATVKNLAHLLDKFGLPPDKYATRLEFGMNKFTRLPICVFCNQFFDPDSDTGLSKDQNCLVRKGYVPFFDDRYPECYSIQEFKSKKQANPYSAKSMARQGKILKILDGEEFAKIVINEKKAYQNNGEPYPNRKSSNLRKLPKQRARTAPTSF